MVKSAPAPTFEDAVVAHWIERIGWPASLVSALAATILLIGDLVILFFGYVPLSWQLEALRGGTVLALVLSVIGALAKFTTYYRWSRILRGQQKLKLKEEALDVPGYLDDLVPKGRRGILRGCQAPVTVVTLVVAVALTTLTLGPGAIRVLAVGPLGPGGRILAFGAGSATPASSAPTATAPSGASCHAPAPPAGFSTLTTGQGVCWNYPSTWSAPAAPAGNTATVVAPDAQHYFTVFETPSTPGSVFNPPLGIRAVQEVMLLAQAAVGSGAPVKFYANMQLPSQTSITLGATTWTVQDIPPYAILTRGGTTFDVTLLLTQHAGTNIALIVVAPQNTASTDFTTFFQPMVQSLTFAS